ncbi:DUF2326 domain-containing protein [Vibrio cholerae]|uniref:Flagellar protein FlgN n=7 Tax=Vibrio TaxID=662 RepID=A0A271VQW2_VIBMT|nr:MULTISPECIES: DUF2326 domain-containing protein [Vibrio]EGR0940484.1 flagellar protein FlgN [Vibrio cholerae]EIA0775251.1 flagellar protein FlgN [Vibrio cholerae]EJK2103439.1 flagellar protein FlgN [Vibrio cholerae]KQB08414.1 hypothetical protein XV94_12635 [Vibrio metoecus]MBO1382512.1 flagellar protein FlgN [Vibrio cholerae]
MLVNLCCDKLIENNLSFGTGLNVLKGDDLATNSIGKSSVLMLIDFCFGGNDFINLCSDVIEEVGDLNVTFTFNFNKELHCFLRNTYEPNKVIYINDFSELTLNDFTDFLYSKYNFPSHASSFRNSTNTFSRIWGKGNYYPEKPFNFKSKDIYGAILPLVLRLVNEYETVREHKSLAKQASDRKSNLKKAFDSDFIPRKLTKSEFESKRIELKQLDSEIERIKSIVKHNINNLESLISSKTLSYKKRKDILNKDLMVEKSHLSRLEDSIKFGTLINKKNIDKVKEFFPQVNIEKINLIESFHSKVVGILKDDIKLEIVALQQVISTIQEEINVIDHEMDKILALSHQPDSLVDELLSLSIKQKEVMEEIRYKELNDSLIELDKIAQAELKESLESSLSNASKKITNYTSFYINKFYDKPVNPILELSESQYVFNPNGDNGTGKLYANMIALDLGLLNNTYLPHIIHDSIVIKNVEREAVENIVKTYAVQSKQVFLAIDEVPKYSPKTQAILEEKCFLQLTKNKLAFGISWKQHN